jgi:hypothetical protein
MTLLQQDRNRTKTKRSPVGGRWLVLVLFLTSISYSVRENYLFYASDYPVQRPLSIGKELQQPTTIAYESEKEQHAIIIPYRNRSYHLAKFTAYMIDYLQDYFPNSEFSLWIIEQNGDELFNRAWLTNVGVKEILAHNPKTQCIILHDVDLVPDSPNRTSGVGIVPYDVCTLPTQLGSEMQHFQKLESALPSIFWWCKLNPFTPLAKNKWNEQYVCRLGRRG